MMNMYTPEQMRLIFKILISSPNVPSVAVKAFISDDSDFVTNDIKVNVNCHDVYQRMRNFRWTKSTGNFPDRERKYKMKRLMNIIFEAKLKDVPLYINDEMVGPIFRWRLQNNL
jgi:hypothetical protein